MIKYEFLTRVVKRYNLDLPFMGPGVSILIVMKNVVLRPFMNNNVLNVQLLEVPVQYHPLGPYSVKSIGAA